MKPRRGSAPKIAGARRLHHRDSRRDAAGAAARVVQRLARDQRPARRRWRHDATDIDLLVGRSTILNVGSPITRVSLTVPDVADAMVTSPQQLLIHGKTPGTISMFVWDKRRRHQDLRGQRPPRPEAAGRAGEAAVPRRADQRRRQRQGRRPLRHRDEQVRHRQGGRRRGRLRREEGERRQPAEAAGRRGVEPGHAARPLRRSEPQRDAGARREPASRARPATRDWIARTTTQQFAAPDFTD